MSTITSTPVPLSSPTSIPKNQDIIDGEPYFYFVVFLIIVMFISGICWIFCCGTCVGQDLLKLMGLDRFLPEDKNSFRISSNRRNNNSDNNRNNGFGHNYEYFSIRDDEEEWEMYNDDNHVSTNNEDEDDIIVIK